MLLYSYKRIIHYSLPLNNRFTEPVIFTTSCASAWCRGQDESHPRWKLSEITLAYISELIKLQLKITLFKITPKIQY